MKVLLDLRCDVCEHIVEDAYEEGGQGDYGTCEICVAWELFQSGDPNVTDLQLCGTMRQIFSTGGFNMNPMSSLNGKTGRTTNGTKWTVEGRPRKYNIKTGKYGSEVL